MFPIDDWHVNMEMDRVKAVEEKFGTHGVCPAYHRYTQLEFDPSTNTMLVALHFVWHWTFFPRRYVGTAKLPVGAFQK